MNEIKQQYLNGQSLLSISKDLDLPYRKVRAVLSKENLIRTKKRIKNTEFNYDYFYNINTQEKAYFLGLFHGDACVHKITEDKLRFTISLKEEDGYLISKLVKVLNLPTTKARLVTFPNKTCSNQINFQTGNKDFILPLVDIKSKKIIEKIPDDLKRHFLRGVFDADGTIYTKYSRKVHKYYYMGYIGNIDLMEMLNLYSPIKFKYRATNSKGIYRSEIYSKNDIITFGDFLYKDSTIHMNRKYAKFLDAKFHYSTSTTTWKTPDPEMEGGDIV